MTFIGSAAALLTALPLLTEPVSPPSAWSWQPPTDDSVLEAQDPTRDEAAEAFAAGEAAYVAADYPAAVQHFRRAQTLLPHPFTEYNLGLALARADRPLEAWTTFEALLDRVDSPEQRADVAGQLAALSPRVARLRVDAPKGHTITVDDEPLVAGGEIHRRPGPAVVRVGTREMPVDLRGGELRHLDLRWIQPPPPRPDPYRRLQTGLLASAAVLAAGTTGTAAAAAFASGRDGRRPLSQAAVGLGGATLAVGLTALIVHLRSRPRPR